MQRHLQPATAEMLRLLLETALDAVVAMRPDGTIAAWSQAAERTFGWTGQEALDRPMADLIVPPRYREAHWQGLSRYNEGGEARVLNSTIEISALHKDGQELPVELSITTALTGEDRLFVGFLRDISARRLAESRLQRQAREAELLFRVTRLASETDSFEQALKACLEAICDLTGWPVGHALVPAKGDADELVSANVWHESSPGEAAAMKAATEQVRFTRGVGMPGMILESGEPLWMADTAADSHFARKEAGFGAAFGFPVSSEGRVTAVFEFFSHDSAEPDPELLLIVRTLGEQVGRVLERKRTEEHQRLLVNELNHRVKNTLAIVQSLAVQTFKGESRNTVAAFESRLGALAAAHDVLTAESWDAASLHEVIEKSGLGCGAGRDRIQVDGPDLRIQPKSAVALSMALHELCTNAVKYGALSGPGGLVRISSQLLDSGGPVRLVLRWEESGGPPVAVPDRRGFGSRLIERGLAAELGGTAIIDFAPTGVVCTIEAPLPL
jgi:PAS domain S-box-containing protein